MPHRLADAASPYLRQHADDPVDWYPWGPEALAEARRTDRPILLSLGYSACHWCHVMARESFSDEALAAWLAERFIAVKVDREERPDLDTLYMTAVQAFTRGHGGWPMTLVLTPEGAPFLGGTYFPPTASHGRPSFRDLMERAHHLWTHERDRALAMAERVVAHQVQAEVPPARPAEPPRWTTRVVAAFDEAYDATWGGVGRAPKFPPHGALAVLLAHHHTTGETRPLEQALHTLDAMARGGTYDLVGGGFARYSTDRTWAVPHFEKMLIDQALLAPVYVDAYRLTGASWCARVARETLDYVARDMTGPEGAFLASEDADSPDAEGTVHEGSFYLWTPAQLVDALGPERGTEAARVFGVTEEGTFERGTSVLRLATPFSELDAAGLDRVDDLSFRLDRARRERPRPGVDDKRITAWNALMIRAFALGAMGLDAPEYLQRATTAADFLLRHATVDGRLHRIWKDGRARQPGFLDDHAHLAWALLALWEATLDPRWLDAALDLADRIVDGFWDDATDTCFFTARDAEALVARPRHLVVGAEPSPNGVVALVFAQLAALCGRDELGDRADRLLASLSGVVARAPRAVDVEALAALWRTGPVRQVGIVLPHDRARPEPLLRTIHRRYDPLRVLGGGLQDALPPTLPWLTHQRAVDGRPTALVCHDHTCQLPTTDPATLAAQLDAGRGPA